MSKKKLLQELPVGFGMTGQKLPNGRWDTWDGSQCGCGPWFCGNRPGCKDGKDVFVLDGYDMSAGYPKVVYHMVSQAEYAKQEAAKEKPATDDRAG